MVNQYYRLLLWTAILAALPCFHARVGGDASLSNDTNYLSSVLDIILGIQDAMELQAEEIRVVRAENKKMKSQLQQQMDKMQKQIQELLAQTTDPHHDHAVSSATKTHDKKMVFSNDRIQMLNKKQRALQTTYVTTSDFDLYKSSIQAQLTQLWNFTNITSLMGARTAVSLVVLSNQVKYQNNVTGVRIAGLTYLVSSLEKRVNNITNLTMTIPTLASKIQNVSSVMLNLSSNMLNTALLNELDNITSLAIPTLASQLSSLNSDVDTTRGDLQSQLNATADAVTALSADVSYLNMDVDTTRGDLQSQLNATADAVTALSADVSYLNMDVDTAQGNLQSQLNATSNTISNLSTSINNINSDLNSTRTNLQSQLNATTRSIGNLTSSINSLNSGLNSTRTDLQSQLNATSSVDASLSTSINTLNSDLNSTRTNLQSQLNATTKSVGNLTTLINNLNSDLNTTRTNLQSQLNATTKSIGNLSTSINSLNSDLNTSRTNLQSQLNATTKSIGDLSTLISNVDSDLNTTQTYLQSQLTAINKTVDMIRSNCFFSCKDAYTSGSKNSGIYTLCPSGSFDSKFFAYCDQGTDSGGWMLFFSYYRISGGSTPLEPDTLPTNPSNGYSHVNLNSITGYNTTLIQDLRFYCETSNHARKIHFKTSNSNLKAIAWLGIRNGTVNTVASWNTGFTTLVGHTAVLPGGTDTVASGDLYTGFTGSVFYKAGSSGNRWTFSPTLGECDDNLSTGASTTTLHQVWVRMTV